MGFPSGKFFEPESLAPSLREAFGKTALDPRELLQVPIFRVYESEVQRPAETFDRSEVRLLNDETVAYWPVASLRALYRGTKVPPELGDYPEAYQDVFSIYDLHLAEFTDVYGPPRDEELREVFSNLRRRPDGKSGGFLHDVFWQVSALVLGMRELSEAEFAAIVARMERSCRTFSKGPSSRNFATTVRDMLDSRRAT